MDLFNDNNLDKLRKQENLSETFVKNKMNIQILSNSDPFTPYESLLHIKILFQKMLPKMPRDYILRQVFDENHVCLTLNQPLDENKNIFRIIGAVCYQPCFERKINEIIFFAIDSDFHINGFGSFLFSCLKEVSKLQYLTFSKMGESYKSRNLVISDLNIFSDITNIDISTLFIPNIIESRIPEDAPESENHYSEEEDSEINLYDYCLRQEQAKAFEMSNNKEVDNIINTKESMKDDNSTYGNTNDGSKHIDDSDGPIKRSKTKENDRVIDLKNFYIYFLTYADNSAVGFFKKQGFSLTIRSRNWIGYIKDYEGGTLMESKIFGDINYLKKHKIMEEARSSIFEEMKKFNDFHILYKKEDRSQFYEKLKNTTTERRKPEEFLFDFLNFLLCSLQTNPSAWPFHEPVSIKDVPDYLDVVTNPIDMSLMSKKLKSHMYKSLKKFSDDVELMCSNCMLYNGPDTQYYKCAENIRNALSELILNHSSVIQKWGYSFEQN